MNQLFALGVCFISIKPDLDQAWMSFKETYNKTYVDTVKEEFRKQIFINNTLMIQKHNDKFHRNKVTFNMEMNKFGDLTHDEFLELFSTDGGELWRGKRSMKGINDQIPSAATIEEADAIAARYNVHYNTSCPSLSIPYPINCSHGVGNHGCKGGLAYKACELVEETKKMPDERSFKRSCELNKMKNTVALNIKHCVTRPHTNMDISKELCTRGPVSASISAENPSFQFAKEGIYYEEQCHTTPNHEVLLVGYQDENTENPYWIVKNSFGLSWGDKGFLKISTKASKAGCRIISSVSYPVFSEF